MPAKVKIISCNDLSLKVIRGPMDYVKTVMESMIREDFNKNISHWTSYHKQYFPDHASPFEVYRKVMFWHITEVCYEDYYEPEVLNHGT